MAGRAAVAASLDMPEISIIIQAKGNSLKIGFAPP